MVEFPTLDFPGVEQKLLVTSAESGDTIIEFDTPPFRLDRSLLHGTVLLTHLLRSSISDYGDWVIAGTRSLAPEDPYSSQAQPVFCNVIQIDFPSARTAFSTVRFFQGLREVIGVRVGSARESACYWLQETGSQIPISATCHQRITTVDGTSGIAELGFDCTRATWIGLIRAPLRHLHTMVPIVTARVMVGESVPYSELNVGSVHSTLLRVDGTRPTPEGWILEGTNDAFVLFADDDLPGERFDFSVRHPFNKKGARFSLSRGSGSVTLPSYGKIMGTLSLDPLESVEWSALRVCARRADTELVTEKWSSLRDGRYELDGITPGLWVVEARSLTSAEPLAISQPMRVLPLEDCTFPELHVPLAGQLAKLSFTDPEGRPMLVNVMTPRGQGWLHVARGSSVHMVCEPGSPSSCTALAPGFLAMEITLTPGTQDLQLLPGIPIEVEISGLERLDSDIGRALVEEARVHIVPTMLNPAEGLITPETATVWHDSPARSVLQAPGVYYFDLSFQFRLPNGRTVWTDPFENGNGTLGTVRISDTSVGRERIVLQCPERYIITSLEYVERVLRDF